MPSYFVTHCGSSSELSECDRPTVVALIVLGFSDSEVSSSYWPKSMTSPISFGLSMKLPIGKPSFSSLMSIKS